MFSAVSQLDEFSGCHFQKLYPDTMIALIFIFKGELIIFAGSLHEKNTQKQPFGVLLYLSGESEAMKDCRSSRKREEGQNCERVSYKVIYLNTVKN